MLRREGIRGREMEDEGREEEETMVEQRNAKSSERESERGTVG